MTRCICVLFGVSLMACSGENALSEIKDPNNNDGVEIEVSPRTLQFSALTTGQQEVQNFTITSVGINPLDVDLVEVIGDQAASFAILTTPVNFTLNPGESQDIEVVFSPMDANEVYAEALVESNAGNEEQALVNLQGEGLIGALDISPDPLDFGQHYIGCSADNEVTITNVGNEAVEIYDINHSGQPFDLQYVYSLPLSLAPSESITVNLGFTPIAEPTAIGQLSVVSSEPMGTRVAMQTGDGLQQGQITQEWEFAINPPSDIMFSVDASCSMSDNTSQLASNFSSFISQLSNYSSDWQVMVTGGDTGCNVGGILTPNTPNYANTFQQAVKCKDDLFSSYFGVCNGMGSTYTEALLTEARNALEKTDAGECNAGFIRNNAMLHIVLVSDEPEQSDVISGETWQLLTNQIIAKRGSPGLVRISSIVGDVPNGCQSGGWFGSSADPGTGYVDATNYTNGVFLSICDNWSSPANLQLLAEASVLLDAYPLDYAAVESSITVTVNNYNVNGNYWHYDAGTQSVIFDQNAPSEGSTVVITYSPIGLCD